MYIRRDVTQRRRLACHGNASQKGQGRKTNKQRLH
jgi:hypothetical protein